MRNVPTGIIQQANSGINQPIWLYRVQLDPSSPSVDDIFLAEYNENVTYFRTDAGVDTPQVYRAFPISHAGISENDENKSEGLEITVANVSQEIQYYLEQYSGLRGRKVTVRLVFADELADPLAYVEDAFYIDEVAADASNVTFTLISVLDVFEVQLPKRLFTRDHCDFTYKGQGCWIASGGGFVAPTDFNTSTATIYNSADVVGGASVDTGTASKAHAKFSPIDLRAISKTNDSFLIDIKCTQPTKIAAGDGQIEITSSGTQDSEEWTFHGISTLGITAAWQTITIPLTSFSDSYGGPDLSRVNFIRVYAFSTDGTPLVISWRNARISRANPGQADTCDKTLANCILHNNQARYGAFPTVPRKSTFRV